MDVIVFCGQSNMQGQSECLSNTEPVPGAHEYKFLTDTIVPLQNPVGEDIKSDFSEGYPFTKTTDQGAWVEDHIAGSACYGHDNLVPAFCDAYIAAAKREVLAVHVAKGSTEIAWWLPGGQSYGLLVKKTNAAKKKVDAERVFFVWLQGESDAIDANTKSYYKNQLITLCEALKKDVGIEKFGIIRVGRFTNDHRDDEIIAAQDEICAENTDFLMLTTIATELNKAPQYMNPFVKGHYSAKGLEILGVSGGKALGKFVAHLSML